MSVEVLQTIKASIESLEGTDVFYALSPMLPALEDAIEKAHLSQGVGERPWCDGPYIVTPSKHDYATFHIRGPMGPPTKESVPFTSLVLEHAPTMVDLIFRIRDDADAEGVAADVERWCDEFSRAISYLNTKGKT